MGLAVITGLIKKTHCNEHRIYCSSSLSISIDKNTIVFSGDVPLCSVHLCGCVFQVVSFPLATGGHYAHCWVVVASFPGFCV